MRTSRMTGILAAAILATMAGTASAGPVGTNFTYQGRLTNAGVGQSASYDIRFQLYDAAAAGSLLGTVTKASVPLTNGVFTVDLDFGVQFTGDQRWLQIAVKPAGGPTYTSLSPRQELAPTPNAQCLRPLAYTGESEPGGSVVYFFNSDTTNPTSRGIAGQGYQGVYGLSTTGGTNSYGVVGECSVSGGNGVYGLANTGSNAFGVWGQSASGYGVVGSGLHYGGYFSAGDPVGYGVYAVHTASTGTNPGLLSESYSTDSLANAVVGHITSTSPGGSSTGVRGINDGTGGLGIGVWGSQAGSGWGVYGSSASGIGVYGTTSGAGSLGVDGTGQTGVYGYSNTAGGYGVRGIGGSSATGVRGESSAGGGGSYGVWGYSTSPAGNGVRGEVTAGSSAYGIWGVDSTGASGSYAGYFSGNVNVAGTLSKSGGSFKIDHPLDPANKYLYHSFVESPDMMNIYNGNAALDGSGMAVITMPDWFDTLNTEFRYQLTPMGAPGPNLYIASEMHNRQFTIAGGTPGGKVSWQITGIRQDAWANAHRIPVEEAKRPEERGRFIHPELYGMPRSASLDALKPVPAAPAPQRFSSSQDPANMPATVIAPVPSIKEQK